MIIEAVLHINMTEENWIYQCGEKDYLFNIDFIYWKPGQNSDLEMQCRK